jgi:hypothetical protein
MALVQTELPAMNASLLTADRTTHLKIMLVVCMCSLGAFALAANVSGRKDRMASDAAESGWLAMRSASDEVAAGTLSRAPAGARLVIVSLRTNSM